MKLTEKQSERFWSKVNKTETCWLWTAGQNGTGYGRFSISIKKLYAHRLSYEMFVGEIPEGMVIDHKCRQRACLRPDHLEVVTPKENVARGLKGNLTHCSKGHLFTEENTYFTTDKKGYSHRDCKTCSINNAKARRAIAQTTKIDVPRKYTPKTFCSAGHPLTEENVYLNIRKNARPSRRCKLCQRSATKQYKQLAKAS